MKEGEIIKEEIKIAKKEIDPENRLQNQIRLAVDLLKRRFPDATIDLSTREGRNEVIEYWDEYDYSSIYEAIEKSIELQQHERLKGDMFDLEADDLIYYKENGKLPPSPKNGVVE